MPHISQSIYCIHYAALISNILLTDVSHLIMARGCTGALLFTVLIVYVHYALSVSSFQASSDWCC